MFYEGHLPAFAVNTLIKKGLGRPGVDEHLETIFARGIDPDTEAAAVARGNPAWPARADVQRIRRAPPTGSSRTPSATPTSSATTIRCSQGAQALWTILEHEEMHQETLAYMWHQLPYAAKRKPEHYVTVPPTAGAAPGSGTRASADSASSRFRRGRDARDARRLCLGQRAAGAHGARVDAFDIDVHNVTNAAFLEFVNAGGYRDREVVAGRGLGVGDRRTRHASAVLGASDSVPAEAGSHGSRRGVVLARRCSSACRYRSTGPSTSRGPRRTPMPGGAAGACRRRRVSPCRVRHPDGRERRYPWGDALARPPAGELRLPALGSGAGRRASGGGQRVRRPRSRRQRLGMDLDGVRARSTGSRRFRRIPNTRPTSSTASTTCMKGASPVTARELVRPGLPQLVPPAIPVRLRDVSHGGSGAGPA